MFGMPSNKREGQTMLNMCMEQCEGVYLMDEIERLRLANSDLQMHYDYAKDEVLKLEAEVNRMRYALDKYDCLHRCTEPCALYAMEKERENDFPHMICGWWASSALKEKE